MQSPLRILFIDDHASLRDGLGLLLSKRNPRFEFLYASDLAEGASLIKERADIALAVVDLNLDGEDGLRAVSLVRSERKDLPVIVYSMYADSRHIERALEVGVQGYVTKNDGTDELESAIKIVSAGGICYSAAAASLVRERLFGSADAEGNAESAASYERYMELSKSEQEVFALLAQKKDTAQIAQILAKKEKTVINQRTMIYQKLGIKDLFALIDYARALGVIV